MVEINIFRHSRDAITLQPGELLFRQGEQGDVMFAIVEGVIELLLDGRIVEEVGPGGILGELALIDAAPRSASATAQTEARVVPIDQTQFTHLVDEHPTFALQVMRIMAERLRRTNEAVAGS